MDEQDYHETVAAAFPELDRIESDALREDVLDAWCEAMAENGITDLDSLPCFHPLNGNSTCPTNAWCPMSRT
jgi:hypothetical protein